jgi:multiple sugar transport system ATP-binding protein
MGDRIVVMKDGQIQQNDSPLHLYNHPVNQFVAGFIGSPSMNFITGRLTNGGSGLVFDEGNIQLPLPGSHSDGLRDHADQEVILGIRPEDIHDPDTMGRGVDAVEIQATVEVVEPMGNEVFLYLTTGKSSFVARVDPLHVPVVEQQVKLAVEIDKAHFFDQETQISLLNRN